MSWLTTLHWPDGNVYVCTNHRGHKNYAYGNIFEKVLEKYGSDLKSRKLIMDKIKKQKNSANALNCVNLMKVIK